MINKYIFPVKREQSQLIQWSCMRLTFLVVGGQWSVVGGSGWESVVSVLMLCIIIIIVVIIMFIMYVGGFVIQRNYGISGFDFMCNSQFL